MKNGDKPACPVDFEAQAHDSTQGLTKREYFAAMAMQGFLSQGGYYGQGDEVTAKAAVSQADALLKELEK